MSHDRYKIKIKITSLIGILFVLVSLIKMRFFYLGFRMDYNLVFILTLLLYAIYVYKCGRARTIIEKKNNFFSRYVCFSCFIYGIDFIYSYINYPLQGFRGTMQIAFPYFMVLLAFPILVYMIEKDGVNSIFFIINLLAFIWYIIVIIQYLYYWRYGVVILKGYYNGIPHTRNGRIRIGLYEYGNIAIIYNFYKMYVSEKYGDKFKYLLLCVMGVGCLVFIEQTRMNIIAILCALFGIIVLYKKRTRSYYSSKVVTVFIALCILVYSLRIIVLNVISSNLSLQDSVSTVNRLYALKYYWQIFLDRPLFGIGFANSGFYPQLVMGDTLRAATSDTGIVGQLSRMGIWVLPIYIGMLGYFYHVTRKIKMQKNNSEYILLASFLIFLLISSGSLIIFDMDRYLLYPILCAVYRYYEISVDEKIIFFK